jgi:hypothetical protein
MESVFLSFLICISSRQDIKILNVEVFQDPYADVEKDIETERRARITAEEEEEQREVKERNTAKRKIVEDRLASDTTVGKYLKKRCLALLLDSLI